MRASNALWLSALVALGAAGAWALLGGRVPADRATEAGADDVRAAQPEATPPLPLAVLGGNAGIAEVPAHLVPTSAAVSFLIACQADDGLFDEERGALAGDPAPSRARAVATTALSCLVLVDAVSPNDAAPAGVASRRGLDRLASLQASDGSIGDGFEAHALAAWALASGYSRTGRAEWGRTIPAARAHAIRSAHEGGGWRGGSSVGGDLVVTAWMAVFLFETLPFTETLPDDEPAREAIGLAAEWAASVDAGSVSGAAAAARALLSRMAGEPQAPLSPDVVFSATGSMDHAGSCLGTVHAFHDPAQWPAWRATVFLPALAAQRREGAGAGSWDPGAGRGRVESTALETLAYLSVAVPYRPPRGR